MPEELSTDSNSLKRLIGFGTLAKPLESWYAFVSRLIRANLLNDQEVRQHLPESWVRIAFAPHIPRDKNDMPVGVEKLCNHASDIELKLSPAPWNPFQELASVPPECLRGCPRCLEAGYHSYAMQGGLISRCPVHSDPLTYSCPSCGTRMLWRAHTIAKSAFQCPHGCSLTNATYSGLIVPWESELSEALQQHLAWIRAVRKAITFVSAPAYIAYPPYLMIAPPRNPPLPSPGLLPAVCQAARDCGAEFPPFFAWHESSPGRWQIQLQPWDWSKSKIDADAMEEMRRLFRRGAYQTVVPILNPADFEEWLRSTKPESAPWHHQIERAGSIFWTYSFPSYLVTNNEVTALRRLLARGGDLNLAYTHYERFLLELLKFAQVRRAALDRLNRPTPQTTLGERFEVVLQLGTTYWRVSGCTYGGMDSHESWRNFREPAEMGAGIIHVTRRYDVR